MEIHIILVIVSVILNRTCIHLDEGRHEALQGHGDSCALDEALEPGLEHGPLLLQAQVPPEHGLHQVHQDLHALPRVPREAELV